MKIKDQTSQSKRSRKCASDFNLSLKSSYISEKIIMLRTLRAFANVKIINLNQSVDKFLLSPYDVLLIRNLQNYSQVGFSKYFDIVNMQNIIVGVVQGFVSQSHKTILQRIDLLYVSKDSKFQKGLFEFDQGEQLKRRGIFNFYGQKVQLQSEIGKVIKQLSQLSGQALTKGRGIFHSQLSLKVQDAYAKGINKMQEDVCSLQATKQGIKAFKQKRKPNFIN